jgi:hypothetical protein
MQRLWLTVSLLMVPALGTAGGSALRPPAPSSGPAGHDPRSDLFLGYSYTKAGEAGLHGWHFTGSHPLEPSLRVVAELSGHYGSFAQADLSQLTFMAGGRWTPAGRRIAPFAQALLGLARTKTSVPLPGGSISDSDTDWGAAFGGGADYRFSVRWAVRAQLDLLVLRGEAAWDTDPRLSLGVVYRLGR